LGRPVSVANPPVDHDAPLVVPGCPGPFGGIYLSSVRPKKEAPFRIDPAAVADGHTGKFIVREQGPENASLEKAET